MLQVIFGKKLKKKNKKYVGKSNTFYFLTQVANIWLGDTKQFQKLTVEVERSFFVYKFLDSDRR